MADEPFEYTVRDYSAIDKQIDEIAKREGVLTKRLSIENIKKYALIGLLFVAGVCALMLFAGISYRIAFPPDSPKIIKEVIKESKVPVEVIKEVIKEVKVPVEVIKEVKVPVEVIKEVKVPVEVIREVVKEVRVTESTVSDSSSGSSFFGKQINKNSSQYKEIKQRQQNNNMIFGKKVDVSLIWDNLNDLDLYIKCPDGELIYYLKRKAKNGGQLDIDRNVHNKIKTLNPIEHITWENNPPKGKYEIMVNLANHDPKYIYSDNKYEVIIALNNGEEIRRIAGVYGAQKGIKKKVGEFFIFQ